MKKLLLMLAGLALVVACNEKPSPTPDGGALKLDETTATLTYGKELELTVTGATGAVEWTTDNDFSAVVSADEDNDKIGIVVGLAIGTATITATDEAGNTATCVITAKATYPKAYFTDPFLTWGADTATIKAAEKRQYNSSQTQKDTTMLIYNDMDVVEGQEFANNYFYLVANKSAEPGLFTSEVYVPVPNQEAASPVLFSFAERNRFLGKLETGEQVFMNKDRTYSILAFLVYTSEDKSTMAFVASYIPFTDWENAAPSMNLKKAEKSVFQMSNFNSNILPSNSNIKFVRR